MLTFSYVEINLIAVTILFIIFFNIRNKKDKYLYDQKLFSLLLLFNTLILLFDTLTWVFNMRTGETARYINVVSNSIYYMLNPVPCMIWALYADFNIYKNERRIKRISIPLSIPVLFNAVLAVLSPFKELLFHIDSNNSFKRGELFHVMCVINYSYFVVTFIKLIRRKNRLDRNQFIALVTFAIPPFLAAIFQIMFYGISIIWVSMALSMLFVFVHIQNNQLYTDYLTRVYNRRQLDNYLYQKIKHRVHNTKYLAGIMIDVNSFKQINDLYGHTAGDNALICVADILKRSFRKNDFIARYGGDEFVVVVEISEKAELTGMINRLREHVEYYNSTKIIPFEISLSIGYDVYKTKTGVSIQKFYRHIDKLMYEDKRGRAVS